MNETEQEAIILNTAWGMIDDMVNWAMIVRRDEPLREVMFVTSEHARLFNILLGDFLSSLKAFKGKPPPFGLRPPPPGARHSDLTFLYYLRQICREPHLGSRAEELEHAVESFGLWLEREIVAEGVNLSSIDVVTDLRIQRLNYIRICGNIGKHNIARLENNASLLRNLISNSGHPITEQDSYLALSDFYEWFHGDIFLAHASAVADFLNNIRIAIHHYAMEEFARAYRRTDDPMRGMYHFDVPATISQPAAIAMYWDLMNRVRSGLFMQEFAVSDFFKSIS